MKAVTLLFIFMSFTCSAQKVSFGFRGGSSFSNFYNHRQPYTQAILVPGPGVPPPPEQKTYETGFFRDIRTGFFSEVILSWKLKEKLQLDAGAGYVQKGINLHYTSTTTTEADFQVTRTTVDFVRDLRSEYLSIPVVVRYKLGRQERFYILGGIYNAIGLKFRINKAVITERRETTGRTGIPLITTSESGITGSEGRRFDAGLTAGAGVEWPLSTRWRAGFDLRANAGLINLPAADNEQFFDFKLQARNINVESGIRLMYIM